jgi:hypothetical protein
LLTMTDTALVYIRKADETREFAGCGALIEGPYIATCRHVWRDAEGDANGGVIVEFPRSLDGGGMPEQQNVGMADACDATVPAPDLVLLSVGALPTGVYALPVATEERFETGTGRIHAFKKSRGTDVFVSGTIQPGTTAKGLRQISGDADSGYWTEKGSSGSPAFLDNGMQLAGILLLSETGNPPERVAFILPGSAIRRQLERIKADGFAAEMGVSVSTLEQAIPGLDLKDTPVSDISAKLAAAVAAIKAKAAEAPSASNSGSDIDHARAEAADKLGGMDTDGALAVWDDLLAKEADALETLTLRRVAMLVEKASIHKLRYEYLAALTAMREIASLSPKASASWTEFGEIEFMSGIFGDRFAAFQIALDSSDVSRRTGNEPETSTGFGLISEVFSLGSNLNGALASWREALGVARRHNASDPNNAKLTRDVFVSLVKIGFGERMNSNVNEACQRFVEALAIIKPLAESAPESDQLKNDLASIQRLIAETGCP